MWKGGPGEAYERVGMVMEVGGEEYSRSLLENKRAFFLGGWKQKNTLTEAFICLLYYNIMNIHICILSNLYLVPLAVIFSTNFKSLFKGITKVCLGSRT